MAKVSPISMSVLTATSFHEAWKSGNTTKLPTPRHPWHKASNVDTTHPRHRIVRVQALEVRNRGVVTLDARIVGEDRRHAARSILAEHQILRIQPREGLFVLALHRRLHRRRQRGFQRIDQR